jgi:molybdenum cofactor biosynthesis protein B
MIRVPHPDVPGIRISCAVITVSDTRSVATDRSGQLLKQLLIDSGHHVEVYAIVKDEPMQIREQLQKLVQRSDLEVLLFNGGTGIAPRDTTFDAIAALLDKELPGFGELFRFLSYQEVGSRAIASRALAGVCGNKLVFSVPGSANAVKLAAEKLILPELVHLTQQLAQPHSAVS